MTKLKILDLGGLRCESTVCLKRWICANHFRSKGFMTKEGETPNLSFKNGEVLCDKTTDGNWGALVLHGGKLELYSECCEEK